MVTRPEFDVIVVGAGPAGSACALTLARNGLDVLILEKARIPGERNMTGGVIYGSFIDGYGMIDLVPEFEKNAPLQRKIISHEVIALSKWDKDGKYRYYKLSKSSFLSRLGLFNLDFGTGHDYSILRRQFDRWFVNLAVQEGAMLSTSTTVHDLLIENGSVVGVVTDNEEIRANLVVDCSGVTSTLVERAGLRERLVPRQLYHGIKRVYRLDKEKIDDRFKVSGNEGKALFFIGDFMFGISGGAFIYTNIDTLSVGIVASMDSMIRQTTERFDRIGKLIDAQDEFENHPMVAELLDGAELVEYSAHNIPKSFKCILKRPYTNGFLVAGDALGSFVKIGPMIDGMRRAIASGIMAAKTYIEAKVSGSFGEKNLSRYKYYLSPIYEDVNRYGRDSFITESSFIYNTAPKLLFASRILCKEEKVDRIREREIEDCIKRVQRGTSTLIYDEDRDYSHISVNIELASKSVTKPWVPSCPFNCYTILTKKGVFASFKDLFEHNLSLAYKEGKGEGEARRKAISETISDISNSMIRFDHVACVSCGTCGAIGPREMVSFGHERYGHGVRYRYG